MTGKYAPKDVKEDAENAAKIAGFVKVLEVSGQMDYLREQFGIAELNLKLDRIEKIVTAIARDMAGEDDAESK